MKTFHCDHCGQLVFFENMQCVRCQHRLAYLPDLEVVGSLSDGPDGLYTSPLPRAAGRTYRLCGNYSQYDACNWAVPAAEANPLCRSCRLTRVIPTVSVPEHWRAWVKLETAKRRLVYSLLSLGLPLRDRLEDPAGGLAFEFLADPPDPNAPRVITGHANGVITVNLAEADDVERERRRHALGEPYRTLLGHFRHESAHYYWDQLVRDQPVLEKFRGLFGDERADYGEALKRYYQAGPPSDWMARFISAYAGSHPWEDWAESWAHYLHMIDTLETAEDCGLVLKPPQPGEPKFKPVPTPLGGRGVAFDRLIDAWFPLTYLMNNLNRGMGLADPYPFILPTAAIEKLRLVHAIVTGAAGGPGR